MSFTKIGEQAARRHGTKEEFNTKTVKDNLQGLQRKGGDSYVACTEGNNID